MATISYLAPWRSPGEDDGAYVTVSTPTQLTFTYRTSGLTETYYGNFVYTGAAVTGGTVNTFVGADGATVVWRIEGLQVPAQALYNSIQSNDGTVIDLLLGGNDSIMGSTNGEPILGGPGADTIIALDGADLVVGAEGDDDVNGNVGEDFVLGGSGADWVRGGKDNDTIFGGRGDDPHINGNLGDDEIYGDEGNDTVYGGQGDDLVSGDDGNDLVSGDLGDDLVWGDAGNDSVTGGAGDDTLFGGSGNDTLRGDVGDDLIYGDSGADLFVWRPGDGPTWIKDFNPAQGDRLQLPVGSTYGHTLSNGNLYVDTPDGGGFVLMGITEDNAAAWVVGG